ncbi:hypothetical protein SEVCU013_0004, partial [Staphylococcus epidermidis VCU013]
IQAEKFMTTTPWPIMVLLIAGIAWLASRNWKIVAGTVLTLLLIGYFDMWSDAMKTIAMIFVGTVVSVVVGIPIGIIMARSDGFQRIVNPILDVMQTMPSFVYLIPVVMLPIRDRPQVSMARLPRPMSARKPGSVITGVRRPFSANTPWSSSTMACRGKKRNGSAATSLP